MSRRRAASDALRNSTVIFSSLAKSKSTAENLDLMLHRCENREVVGVDQHVSTVLERHPQFKRIFKAVDHAVARLWHSRSHVSERSATGRGLPHMGLLETGGRCWDHPTSESRAEWTSGQRKPDRFGW